MRFGLLGPMEIRTDDGEALDPGGERPRSLLALLLLDAGRTVGTERLLEGLYGDEPPTRAANALQSQVSRLRRRLGTLGAGIESLPAGYRLDVAPDTVDVHLFEAAARAGREALGTGEHGRAAELLREALGLWRGPALADLASVPFAHAEADRLDAMRLGVREDLAEAELGGGAGPGSWLVPELRELVAVHPLRERLYGLLMRALRAAGRPAEALAVYEDARRALAEALGSDPSPELAALHLELLRPAAAAVPRPVPARLTSFVGRTRELERLGELLASSRLVTLTGPGGAGKTRLAVEAAERWPGEVCYAELAPVPDAARLPYAVLGALGVRGGGFRERTGPGTGLGPGDATDRLLSALAAFEGRRLLLLLDNCEHLVDEVAGLSALLLGVCPDIWILATSREGLGITGETLVAVEPLGAPAAVRLFLDRAAAVRPGLALRPGDEGHARVEHICAALDGLPLALELAAARLRTLSVGEIADRLDDRLGRGGDDRFRLLSRGDRTKEARHRTLGAVVEWSWELLDEAERELARRLTVFAGGATLDAVERVCGVDDADGLLASLVEKSFVTAVDGRYRMLETVRAFCAAQLGDAEREFRDAHVAYFLATAETAEPLLRGGDQLRWLDRLDAEHTNLLTALHHGSTAASLRLLACLSWYAPLRGRAGELAAAARELLARAGDEPPEGLLEEYALCLLAAVGHREGTDGGAADEALIARADTLMAGLVGRLRMPHALTLWSLAAGPQTGAQSTEAAQAYGNSSPWAAALLRMGRAYQHLFEGRPGPAEEGFAASLDGFRATGDRWGIANALDPLAMFAHWRGDTDRALALLGEALGLVQELRAPEETADMLLRRAHVLLHAGQQAEAVALFTRSAELARSIGLLDKAAGAVRGLGDAARLSGDTARARVHYEAALEGGSADWFGTGETLRVFLGLGRTASAEGDGAQALEWFEQAAALAEETPGRLLLAEIAEARAAAADPLRAAELLGEAEGLRGTALLGDRDVVRTRETARGALSGAEYGAAYERGRRARA
ncbi:BTAD domain-containing putative transcriptional regulator [Streptomyces sp. NPDC021093]|uniref:BTAD domain-containing putative transcriptional regulator n=1 Tax=Streptomyces sp. NPDC021093 TaxID=3365112 RepID=UPI003795CC7D